MSVTTSRCEEIARSPLNNSKSKMLYSFSKSERFKSTCKVLCDKFYDLRDARDTRTAGFGYGRKYDFTRGASCSPPPNTYQIRTTFQESKIHKKGFGFGEGRQEMEVTGILSSIKNNKNPGPGQYQLPTTLSKISYSMKDRFNIDGQEAREIPGPGKYPIQFELNKTGNYFLSKYRNSGAKVFNPKHSMRFKETKTDVPGPGMYDMSRTAFSPEGNYFLSKLSNSKSRTFPHEVRRNISNLSSSKELFNEAPGPGNYRLPSDFGHYANKNATEGSSPCVEEAKLAPSRQLR